MTKPVHQPVPFPLAKPNDDNQDFYIYTVEVEVTYSSSGSSPDPLTTFDAANQIEKITTGANITTYSYDAAGNVTRNWERDKYSNVPVAST